MYRAVGRGERKKLLSVIIMQVIQLILMVFLDLLSDGPFKGWFNLPLAANLGDFALLAVIFTWIESISWVVLFIYQLILMILTINVYPIPHSF